MKYYYFTFGFRNRQYGDVGYESGIINQHPAFKLIELNQLGSGYYEAWLIFAMEITEEEFDEIKRLS